MPLCHSGGSSRSCIPTDTCPQAFDLYQPDLVVSVHPLMQHIPIGVLKQRIRSGAMPPINFATVGAKLVVGSWVCLYVTSSACNPTALPRLQGPRVVWLVFSWWDLWPASTPSLSLPAQVSTEFTSSQSNTLQPTKGCLLHHPANPRMPCPGPVQVVTDFTTCHNTWFHTEATRCFVPTDYCAMLARDNGLEDEQIIQHGASLASG